MLSLVLASARSWLAQWSLSPRLRLSRPVLAGQGSLCRFAPWTAPDRSGGMAVYEGKGAARACAAYRVVDRGKTPCLGFHALHHARVGGLLSRGDDGPARWRHRTDSIVDPKSNRRTMAHIREETLNTYLALLLDSYEALPQPPKGGPQPKRLTSRSFMEPPWNLFPSS